MKRVVLYDEDRSLYVAGSGSGSVMNTYSPDVNDALIFTDTREALGFLQERVYQCRRRHFALDLHVVDAVPQPLWKDCGPVLAS